jgi:hypothetical protein
MISSIAAGRTRHLAASGRTTGAALHSGFQLGYLICAGLMLLSMVVALALFREQGRGERIDPLALATGGLD